MSDLILHRNEGAVAILTINRPKVRNAIDIATVRALGASVQLAIASQETRVLVITGSGDTAFSAGGDLAEMISLAGITFDQAMAAWEDTFRVMEASPKPVIAAVNGLALGGGCEVAMACHLRVGSDSAVLGQPEIILNHLPGAGGTQRLPRLIPVGVAYEHLLTGDPLSAADAHRLGLLNHVWPAPELMDRTIALANRIAEHSPTVVQLMLEVIRLGLQGSLDAGLRLERAMSSLSLETDASKRSLEAFLSRGKK